MALDLSSLLQDALNFEKEAATTASSIISNTSDQVKLANKNASLFDFMGDNAVIIEKAKQTAALQTQEAKLAAANILGTNTKSSTEAMSALASTISTQYVEYQNALSRVQEKNSVGLLDNPLEWMINQLTVEDEEAAVKVASQKLDAAKKQMLDLNTITQSQNRTLNELDESITAASVKASVDNVKALATQKANDEAIKALQYNTAGIQNALQASKESLQTKFSAFNAQKQEQQMKIALAHLEQSRQEFAWKQEEKAKGDAFADSVIDKINRGGQNLYGESFVPIPKGSVKASVILQALKTNTPMGSIYEAAYRSAMDSEVAGTKILAPTPALAIDLLKNVNPNLSPAQSPVKAVLNTTLDLARQAVTTGVMDGNKLIKLDPKDRDGIHAFMNKKAQELVDQQAKLVKPEDPDNIFKIPRLSSIIADSPTVAKLPVVQKILAPAISAGTDLNDPNQVFSLVVKGLRDKTISYPQALELTTVYHVGQSVNLEAKQLTSLGLVPKFSYNAKITTNPGAIFDGADVIDLTKPEQVGRALNKYLAAEILNKNTSQALGNLPAGF